LSPTPAKIAQQRIELGRKLGICVTSDDFDAVRRITRNLRKKLESK